MTIDSSSCTIKRKNLEGSEYEKEQKKKRESKNTEMLSTLLKHLEENRKERKELQQKYDQQHKEKMSLLERLVPSFKVTRDTFG